MAAQEVIYDTSLTLVYDMGMDLDGNLLRKNKNYNNIKTTATVTGLYNVAQAIVGLQQHTLLSAQRQNDYEIVTA